MLISSFEWHMIDRQAICLSLNNPVPQVIWIFFPKNCAWLHAWLPVQATATDLPSDSICNPAQDFFPLQSTETVAPGKTLIKTALAFCVLCLKFCVVCINGGGNCKKKKRPKQTSDTQGIINELMDRVQPGAEQYGKHASMDIRRKRVILITWY